MKAYKLLDDEMILNKWWGMAWWFIQVVYDLKKKNFKKRAKPRVDFGS